jgi:hypothetical protein
LNTIKRNFQPIDRRLPLRDGRLRVDVLVDIEAVPELIRYQFPIHLPKRSSGLRGSGASPEKLMRPRLAFSSLGTPNLTGWSILPLHGIFSTRGEDNE